jgi:hypothetical protein
MDPAELDRWTVFDVEPTVEDWLAWAKDKVADVVYDFINQNRNHLEHTGEFEPNKVYPSRRSWDRLSRICVRAGLLGDNIKENQSDIFYLTSATVGFEAATSFADFCQNYDRQVTVEDVLDKGEIDKTSSFSIADHSALIEKIGNSGRLDVELSTPEMENFCRYFMTVPSECAMAMFELFSGHGDVSLANVTNFHATVIDGKSTSAHLHRMLDGSNDA